MKMKSEFGKQSNRFSFLRGKPFASMRIAVCIVAVTLLMTACSSSEGKPDQEGASLSSQGIQEEWASRDVYSIRVDGVDIIYFETEQEANAVIDGVIAHYATPGADIVSKEFAENVEVAKKEMYEPTVFFSVHDGINYIITGTTEPRVYTVKGGDNLWDIALVNGISPYELQEMNPGLEPKKLKIGQELYLYETQPFLNVRFTELVTATERIDYKTNYQETDSLYKGQTKVTSVGAYGSKEVVSQVVKENGIVISTAILNEAVLLEPVAQVALKGTKSTPVYTGSGSGTLSSPVGHVEVSSAFGSRGGGRHTGVDLRNPKGTPISAAAEGVVTFSGYSGSHGNMVKISHGGGIETLYSHCDTLSVSIGDTVAKGQVIATVGNTGNASGYHVHFEVRVNGVAQNPMNYI